MTIKIEVPAGDSLALNRLGEALVLLAADRMTPLHASQGKTEAELQAAFDRSMGLNSEGDAVDNTTGAQPGDRGGYAYTDEDDAGLHGGEHGDPSPEVALARTVTGAQIEGAVGDAMKKASQDDPTEVDTHGVPFNDKFCGKAAVPFYGSGKRKGQWKKRKGVSDEDYDSWYSGCGAAVLANEAAAEAKQDTPVDTAGAFGGTSAPAETAPANDVPTDCGTFMGWVAAQQAAGRLTQHQVSAVYAQLNLQVTSLFPPNTPDVIALNVANLYAVLSQQATQA